MVLNGRVWLKASLPVRLGDLGVRKTVYVSLPAFQAREGLTRKILINTLVDSEVSYKAITIYAWTRVCASIIFLTLINTKIISGQLSVLPVLPECQILNAVTTAT